MNYQVLIGAIVAGVLGTGAAAVVTNIELLNGSAQDSLDSPSNILVETPLPTPESTDETGQPSEADQLGEESTSREEAEQGAPEMGDPAPVSPTMEDTSDEAPTSAPQRSGESGGDAESDDYDEERYDEDDEEDDEEDDDNDDDDDDDDDREEGRDDDDD